MTTQELIRSAWEFPPGAVAAGIAALVGYGLLTHFRSWWRTAALGAAQVFFFIALASPIAVLAKGYVFSAHVTQHLLLQLIMPPLLLLSLTTREKPPENPWLAPWCRLLHWPALTWALGLGAMWLWHVPKLCSASAVNPGIHLLQGISLLLMGAAFWWPIIGAWRSQWLSPLAGVIYLFSACIGCTVLGIILTFAPISVCPVFLHPHDALGLLPMIRETWGLTPIKDQQLGGLLMWVPPCFVYVCGICGLLVRWYANPDFELVEALETTTKPGLAPTTLPGGKA